MIYGKRIRLRAVEHTDLPKFHDWMNDPEVIEGLSVYLPMSMEDEEKWFEKVLAGDAHTKPFAIEIQDGHGWRLIGDCGIFNLEWSNRSAEFGISIGDKSMWNKGYGTEAVLALLQHGFETLNLNRIYLRVYSTNLRAKRTYEITGFVLEGTMRQGVYRRGKYADVHIMSMLRSEWNASQEGK